MRMVVAVIGTMFFFHLFFIDRIYSTIPIIVIMSWKIIVEYAISIINPDTLPIRQFIENENIRIFNARCSIEYLG
jgi:hypothetical protein